MKITFLGTTSGTEPVPNRQHTSIAVEHDGRLFWLDAGEGCSRTAHLAGIDLPATEAIFISHTHMDHIGGLPNLLWTLRKLASVSANTKARLQDRQIDLFIPNLAVYEAVYNILSNTEGGFRTVFSIAPRPCEEGVLYDSEGVMVKAVSNGHGGDAFRSFSYRLEADGKSLVFSGDVRGVADFDSLIDGCDLLMMETGHHRVEDVCGYLLESGKTFGRLVFVHHGRAVLADAEGECAKARAMLGDRVMVAEDGQSLEI